MSDNLMSEAELELMKIIWKQKNEKGKYSPISTNEIMEHLNGKWNVSTVFTLLTRLERKGYVFSAKSGRSNVYTAIVEERDYLGKESHRIIDMLYDGSIRNLLVSFCDDSVSDSEIAEIERFLEERKKK